MEEKTMNFHDDNRERDDLAELVAYKVLDCYEFATSRARQFAAEYVEQRALEAITVIAEDRFKAKLPTLAGAALESQLAAICKSDFDRFCAEIEQDSPEDYGLVSGDVTLRPAGEGGVGR